VSKSFPLYPRKQTLQLRFVKVDKLPFQWRKIRGKVTAGINDALLASPRCPQAGARCRIEPQKSRVCPSISTVT